MGTPAPLKTKPPRSMLDRAIGSPAHLDGVSKLGSLVSPAPPPEEPAAAEPPRLREMRTEEPEAVGGSEALETAGDTSTRRPVDTLEPAEPSNSTVKVTMHCTERDRAYLNEVALRMYARRRVNGSQLLRALVLALKHADHLLDEEIKAAPPIKKPAVSAEADAAREAFDQANAVIFINTLRRAQAARHPTSRS